MCGSFMGYTCRPGRRCSIIFRWGKVFRGGRNIWDTGGARVPASLTAASTVALLRQSASGRQLRVSDRQRNDLICV